MATTSKDATVVETISEAYRAANITSIVDLFELMKTSFMSEFAIILADIFYFSDNVV